MIFLSIFKTFVDLIGNLSLKPSVCGCGLAVNFDVVKFDFKFDLFAISDHSMNIV